MTFKPQKSKTRNHNQIVVRMNVEEFDELTEVSTRLGMSKNDFVLQALRYAIDRLENPT